jgi:host factor-I protein
MKETMEPLPASSVEKEDFANRKLIRPTLTRPENNGNHNNHGGHNPVIAAMPRERVERHDRIERSNDRGHDRNNHDRSVHDRSNNDRLAAGGGRKPSPPEQTNAENFYYQKQMQSRTPMVIVLRDGEEIHGDPNLMIYKPAIKYMYKEGEGA